MCLLGMKKGEKRGMGVEIDVNVSDSTGAGNVMKKKNRAGGRGEERRKTRAAEVEQRFEKKTLFIL